MMHLLRKYDVAHFIRNDVMFAKSLSEAVIILERNISRKANIIEKDLNFDKKLRSFSGAGDRT